MSNIQTQMSRIYEPLKSDKLIEGNKYLLIKKNYKLFGVFKGFYSKNTNYIYLENHICDVSITGFRIFSLKDIRKRQVQRYFKDILPIEINMKIGEIFSLI